MYARTRFYVPPEFLLRRDLARDLFIYTYISALSFSSDLFLQFPKDYPIHRLVIEQRILINIFSRYDRL